MNKTAVRGFPRQGLKPHPFGQGLQRLFRVGSPLTVRYALIICPALLGGILWRFQGFVITLKRSGEGNKFARLTLPASRAPVD